MTWLPATPVAYFGLAILLFGVARCLWLVALDRKRHHKAARIELERLDLAAAARRRRRRRIA